MIIDPALWNGMPDAVRCLFYRDNLLHLLDRRPSFGKKGYILDRIDYDNRVNQAFVDSITRLIDRIEESNGNQYLIQRPADFNGQVKEGDIVWAKDGEYLRTEEISHTHIVGTNPRGIKMDYHKSWINAVNGVIFSYEERSSTTLVAEVHNNDPVDGAKAIEILKGMV